MEPGARGGAWTAGVLLILGGFAFSCTVVGAVEPWARSVLGGFACAALLCTMAAGRLHPLPGEPRGRVRILPAEGFLLGLVALGLVQILPLPPGLHGAISPESGRVFDGGWPPGEEDRWRTLSVYPWATRLEVLRLAALGMVFTVLARGIRRSTEARFALGGLVALGAVAGGIGILDDALGGSLLGAYPREAVFEDRLAGVLVNPNHFAGLMGMTALCALGLHLARAPGGEGEEGRTLLARIVTGIRRESERGPSVALLLAFFVASGALLLTGSRMGGVSFLVGLGLLLLPRGRGGTLRSRLLPGLVLATLLLLVVNLFLATDPVRSRWSLFFSGTDTAATGRIEAWKAVGGMGLRFPAAGCGLGTFGHLFPAYQPAGLRGTWDHAHNDFLQLFAEGGLPGVLLGLGFLASWLSDVGRTALRGRGGRAALAGACLAGATALLVHATGEFPLQIPGLAWFLFAVMGIGQGLATPPREGGAPRPPGTGPRKAEGRIVPGAPE